MNFLVTGGAGFIGSNLVDMLVNMGGKVTVIDNLSTGNIENINKSTDFIFADLNIIDLKKIIKNQDYIFHLAALPRIQPSFIDPISHNIANVDATIKLLLATADTEVKKVVISSSSAIYGNPVDFPTKETSPANPMNPYALQKYASELYSLLLGAYYKIPIIALRYMNPYGPRSFNYKNPQNAYSSVVGIFHNNWKNKLPHYVTGSGLQKRDFIHVEDVASANLAAALSDIKGEVFNVGTGKIYSILEVANMFGGEIIHIPERSGEANITHADINKITSVLEWFPKYDLCDYIKMIKT